MTTKADVLLAEYKELKAEQRGRIAERDRLMYTTLVATSAVIYAAFQIHDPNVLLGIPALAIVLGWNYLQGDEKIVGLRRYFYAELAPLLEAATGWQPGDPRLLGWERPSNGKRPLRRASRLMVHLSLFVFPAAGALGAWWWLAGPAMAVLRAVWTAEAVAAVLLLGAYLHNAVKRVDRPTL